MISEMLDLSRLDGSDEGRLQINGGKKFRRSEMQGKTKFSDLRNPLNRCNFEGLRLIQGKINGAGAYAD